MVIPSETAFPYTIRIVSDILESNGSSSMATVCAGSLSLMDAAVPVKSAVAGIAMGLVKEADRVAILTDILGDEDHLGDMDFKVAGPASASPPFQMDIKTSGISSALMREALEKARIARMKILDVMDKTLSAPKPEMSPFAPRIISIKIDVDSIGAVMRPAENDQGNRGKIRSRNQHRGRRHGANRLGRREFVRHRETDHRRSRAKT